MKIRNDFVSNSSSSSFIVINDTNKIYPDVQDYHTEYDPLMLPTDEYGGECCFGWEFEKYRSFWSKLNWCAILITQMEMYLNMSEEDKKWYTNCEYSKKMYERRSAFSNEHFEDYKNTVRHVCELAGVFGTDKIRMFSFYKAFEERNKVIDYLSEMVEIGKEFGVYMYHENEKGIYGDIGQRCVDILDNVKGIKCVYDPANFIQCGEKADDTLALLHKRADYFHIKDVDEKSQAIVPAGFGDGKVDKLIKDISDDKVLTLEPHLSAFVGFKDNDKTEMKHKFSFASPRAAFDAAVKATKDLLANAGYKEVNGEFVK